MDGWLDVWVGGVLRWVTYGCGWTCVGVLTCMCGFVDGWVDVCGEWCVVCVCFCLGVCVYVCLRLI